jgi:hypothetical protein
LIKFKFANKNRFSVSLERREAIPDHALNHRCPEVSNPRAVNVPHNEPECSLLALTHLDGRVRGLLFLLIGVLILGSTGESNAGSVFEPNPRLTNSLYDSHHPRLLFMDEEIISLHGKVRDGGNDDDAYAVIRHAAEFEYPVSTMEELLDDDYGLNTIPNLGLAGFLESPEDTAALALGRQITLFIADNYDIDNNDFDSSLRLRSLALGYDMFFEGSPELDKDRIRSEMISYIDAMTSRTTYEIWRQRPFLGNRSVMIAASLGLAAICLDGETDPARIASALEFADEIIDEWLRYQVDEDGAYNEGLVYGSWSMRMLIYYFHARKRYDGLGYSGDLRIRNMQNWFAYELLPEGSGRTNNLNDCAYKDYILSRHQTYFDWAQSEWGSGLCSWLWDHVAGEHGWDWGLEGDKAATVIWNRNLSPQNPQDVLPRSFLWEHRGLYYYRSGWDLGPNSNDVVFSFYSGAFQGAHAQEDQGQFTLYGYGAKFAIDHGPGSVAKQSEAHNIILIDGVGQHNAGSSIGTDGAIREYLLSDYADYIVADLTDAYTTHSKWNNANVPYPGADWSWGYDGGNPVDHALRTVVVVHAGFLPPYLIMLDDIEKDDVFHEYEWRLHTLDANSVDTSADPIQISNGSSWLDIYTVSPPFETLQKSVTPFVNGDDEPDALVLSLAITDASADFALLMLPANAYVRTPSVSRVEYPWGYVLMLDWGWGSIESFVRNTSGEAVTVFADGWITTDATLALVRTWRGSLSRYLLANVTEFTYNSADYVSVADGPLSCALSGGVIQIDRHDADFVFYAPGVDEVYFRKQQIQVVARDGYLTPDPVLGVGDIQQPVLSVEARAFPNPFNPSTSVVVNLVQRAEVRAVVYDVSGKPVKTLWQGVLPGGSSTLVWDGADDNGIRVASGVYFLRIDSRGWSKRLKLVVVR